MSTSNTSSSGSRATAIIAAILGMIAAGVAIFEFREARLEQALLDAANRDLAAIQARWQVLSRSDQAGEAELAKLQAKADNLRSTGTAATNPMPAGPRGSRLSAAEQLADGQRFLATVPGARELLLSVGRSQYEMGYGPFFRLAGLSPPQVEQLESLTMNTWLQSLATAPGGSIHPTVIQPPDDQLRAVLGDQGFQQLQDYNSTIAAHYLSIQVATSAGYAGAPLTVDQANQLAQIVAASSSNYQAGQTLNLNSVNWDAAAAQAQAVFSPAQMQAVQGVFAKTQYRLAMAQARQAQAAAGAGGSGTP